MTRRSSRAQRREGRSLLEGGRVMVKRTLALACVLTVGIVSPIAADSDTLVRFDGGIGVIPVSNVAVANGVVTVNRNIVRGVNPPGQIWVIRELTADVGTDGSISVRGRGLLLGGGNNIGMNANQSVFATLICEAAAPFVLRNTNTAGVPLGPDGDFQIDDVLSPAPEAACASPVLLIRNTGGAWFAAGILKLND
jgi:hypothetical protein